MPKISGRCPACGGDMLVTRLRCPDCDSELTGSFTLGKFFHLPPEQLRFIEAFVKNEGKIKDVEVELGISYPTVRARLREVIRALGYEVGEDTAAQQATTDRRREILDALAEKRISAEEASRQLRALGSDRPQ